MQDDMERIKELATRLHEIAEGAFNSASADDYETNLQLAVMEQLAKEIVEVSESALECPF